jgi:hypothetical protein
MMPATMSSEKGIDIAHQQSKAFSEDLARMMD